MDLNISSAQSGLDNLTQSEIGSMDQVTSNALSSAQSEIQPSTTTTNGNGTGNSQPAERMQLINEEQEFNPNFNGYLKKWDLEEAGFGYDLCAVLGSQSTGKSTLLNALFGTSFEVMSETARRQTTKGIWMSRGLSMNVLIMDVEGTDGRERGEDQDFERKSALFSMASAEVLMVNMWENQVGLYQGANMGLLKTVFEVNLGLFQSGKEKSGPSKDKTLLLFVIRDHVGITPLENLRGTIMADLGKIWDGLNKPENLQSALISDFFDFSFTALPHKLLRPQDFTKQVGLLRQRFTDSKREDYVFQMKYHKRIPADGLSRYLEGVWDQVVSNKDLDLPTQQELLAQFRCDEIANLSFGNFINEMKSFRKPVELGNVVEGLGDVMGKTRGVALASFDKAASRYHQEVYKRKRLDLLEKLNTSLSPLFIGQLKNLSKVILSNFKLSLLTKLRSESSDFASIVSSETETALNLFLVGGNLLKLEETDWQIDEELEQLKEEMRSVSDNARIEETKKMILNIQKMFKKEISDRVEIEMNNPDEEMWDRVLGVWKEVIGKCEETYGKKAKSFNCTPEENEQALRNLNRKCWLILISKIEEQTSDSLLMSKLRSKFEDRFRYDEAGVPRVWKFDDDIDGIFRKARDETLSLIPLYSRIQPSDPTLEVTLPSTSDDPPTSTDSSLEEEEFDFPSTLQLFSEVRKISISNRFRKDADAYYVEAKRSTVSSIAQVPYWMYGVMVVLGWNEAMAVISSPIYFTFLLMLLAGAFVVYKLNLAGPLIHVSKTVLREVHRMADSQLREHFSQPLPRPELLRDDNERIETPLNEKIKVKSLNGNSNEDVELKERKSD